MRSSFSRVVREPSHDAPESVARLVAALRRGRIDPDISLTERRQLFAAAASRLDLAEGTMVEAAEVDGTTVEWLIPAGCDVASHILYLHGGGYVMGSLATGRPLASHLAHHLGRRVCSVDYPLAPESVFPEAAEAVLQVHDRLCSPPGCDCWIVGDSAGGGLALSAVVRRVSSGRPAPRGVVAISPWTDLGLRGTSLHRPAADDPQVDLEMLRDAAAAYAGHRRFGELGLDLRSGQAPPLPPTLIQVGARELLLDDAHAAAKWLRSNPGNDVRLEEWQDMPHVWHAFAPRLQTAVYALNSIRKFVATVEGDRT